MIRGRGASILLAVSLMAGACGGDADRSDRDRSPSAGEPSVPPEVAAWTIPDVDGSTKQDADALHTKALTALISSPVTYQGRVRMVMGTVSISGAGDPEVERSRTATEINDVPEALAHLSEAVEGFQTRTRYIAGRSYGQVAVPELKGCWFDFGQMAGPGDIGWYPPALLVADGYARGFTREDPDVIVIDADAVNLVAAIWPKTARLLYVEKDVPVPVVITLRDGRPVKAEYELGAAIDALVEAGARVPAGASRGELKTAMSGVVTIEYGASDPVEIEAPPASRLIDATALGGMDITALTQMDPSEREALLPDGDVELCAAAE
ncbi:MULTISPECIES: hypothetical protein [unclassified Nocardioides]|uniref:hypothetical protein n=1 Tax=unclassified Nocardioides TaxID=2615069 RepID=UPI000702B371|nr:MULTISPECIES: hypothetical protein [unclassified Nocardioides]KRA38827.1 hypothetical protein ASD81_09610 [Nocardioides sp. Root614]KRA92787.1 hypothetical protein ASD84_09875 [Nocardioides sp. Root682]